MRDATKSAVTAIAALALAGCTHLALAPSSGRWQGDATELWWREGGQGVRAVLAANDPTPLVLGVDVPADGVLTATVAADGVPDGVEVGRVLGPTDADSKPIRTGVPFALAPLPPSSDSSRSPAEDAPGDAPPPTSHPGPAYLALRVADPPRPANEGDSIRYRIALRTAGARSDVDASFDVVGHTTMRSGPETARDAAYGGTASFELTQATELVTLVVLLVRLF